MLDSRTGNNLSERRNVAFMGTLVRCGRGKVSCDSVNYAFVQDISEMLRERTCSGFSYAKKNKR